MKGLNELLSGKKTYITAIVAILYLLAVKAGYVGFSAEILGALGFTSLATLRAGVKKSNPDA